MSIPPRQRTPFARWMWERGLTPKDGEAPLKRSWESIRRYALDYDDPHRRVPDEEVIERIEAWTGGAVTKADFEPPKAAPSAERAAP